MDEKEIWQIVLGELEITLSKANFNTWFKDTFLYSIDEKKAVIGVPNGFAKEWLENKFKNEVISALKKPLPEMTGFECKITSREMPKNLVKIASKGQESENKAPTIESVHPQLNPKYTFDSFVIGNSNRLAAATAQAVANKPGVVYNPLFLYGGVGLGKTHLVQAVGNEILKSNPKKKIVYVSCERFTNDYVSSISSGKILPEFPLCLPKTGCRQLKRNCC